MAGYILDNPNSYVFSAITVSIDSQVTFEPLIGEEKLGVLKVPMDAKFIINDGQHRRAAIMSALEQRPELAQETIAVVFFLDVKLERCQQMFADLNRHAIRPSRSIGLLYDHRDGRAALAKQMVANSSLYREIVDMEKSSLAARSRKLFTLSALYNACSDLVQGISENEIEKDADLARSFWEEVAKQFPLWTQVRAGRLHASEVREDYIHGHGIALQALGRAGNALLKTKPKTWKKCLPAISKIDWSRSNIKLWEGRAMFGGKISKSVTSVALTTNIIKQALSLPLSDEENRMELIYSKSASNKK
jgi:DNA sulfur modification protein DndB